MFEAELVSEGEVSVPTPAAPAAESAPSPAPATQETPAPATETVEATPAPATEAPESSETQVSEPTTPEPVLYELPDGRKLDAEGIRREYLNLLPEFTRKSQELAAIKNGDTPQPPITQEQPEWKNPDYVPSTWAEAIEIAKAEALKEIIEQGQAAQAEEAALISHVDSQLAELKAVDPKLDENSLFQHATKFGFRDLPSAYKNQQEMKRIALDTEQRVLKNLGNRAADPIATVPAAPVVAASDEYDPSVTSGFRSATDFLEAIKKS